MEAVRADALEADGLHRLAGFGLEDGGQVEAPRAKRKAMEITAPRVANHGGTSQLPARAEMPRAMSTTTAPCPRENKAPK